MWRIVDETAPPPLKRRLDELLAEPTAAPADCFAIAVLDPGCNAPHIAMLQAAGGTPATPDDMRAIERKAVYLGPDALSKPERRTLLEHASTMARLHLAAWLHWQGGRGLPWENEEPLPPAPGRMRDRRGTQARITAAV